MPLTDAQQAELDADLAELAELHEKPHDAPDFAEVLGGASLVAGYGVLPHVQAFADAVRVATRVKSIGTYPGHSPSIDRALDLFHAVSDNALADGISDFAIKNQARYGVRYVIDRQEIWHRLDPVWRRMEDRDNGDVTQNHFDHNHISFETTAAVPPLPPPPAPPIPPILQEDTMAVFVGVSNNRGIFLVAGNIIGSGKGKGKFAARRVNTPQEIERAVASGLVAKANNGVDLPEVDFDRFCHVIA